MSHLTGMSDSLTLGWDWLALLPLNSHWKVHYPSSYHKQVASGLDVPPSKSTSHLLHAVTIEIATSQPPGHKTLGPNSSSLHILCTEDYSKTTTCGPSVVMRKKI